MIKLVQYLPKPMQYAAGFAVSKILGIFLILSSKMSITVISFIMNIILLLGIIGMVL
jgi:hypothetical protein